MFNRVFKFFSSLRLTVTLLAFGILLVFVGTVAQADEGLYQAQARYFKHWFVWGITLFGHKIPLACRAVISSAPCCSSTSPPRTSSAFRFTEKTRHPPHARRRHPAARRPTHHGPFLARDTTALHGGRNQVVVRERDGLRTGLRDRRRCGQRASRRHSQGLLANGGELKHEQLPFTIHVKNYWRELRAAFRAPMQQNAPPLTDQWCRAPFRFLRTARHAQDG